MPRWRQTATAVVGLIVTAGTLAACGGGSNGGGSNSSRAEKIASCIDATTARASTFESALKSRGAIGGVKIFDPVGTVHVFKSAEKARAYAQEKDPNDLYGATDVQIGDVVLYQGDKPELVNLVTGCVK